MKKAGLYWRGIVIYLIIWLALAGFLFLFLRWRYIRNYTNEKYEAMLMTTSRYRVPVDDPCQHQIYGDPVTTFTNFAKVLLYCGKNETATNSIDLGVLKENSYKALLTEVGRINGFSVSFIGKEVQMGKLTAVRNNRWFCFDDHVPIEDFSAPIKPKSRMECFFGYSLQEINAKYANN